MKTAWNGTSRPATGRSSSKDSRCRPKAFRATAISIRPSGQTRGSSISEAARTMPAQVAKTPPSNSRRGRRIPCFSISREIVVDSPPGTARPSSPASDPRAGRRRSGHARLGVRRGPPRTQPHAPPRLPGARARRSGGRDQRPRNRSTSLSGRVWTSRPRMAVPSPFEISARRAGSSW